MVESPPVSLAPVTEVGRCSKASGSTWPSRWCHRSAVALESGRDCAEWAANETVCRGLYSSTHCPCCISTMPKMLPLYLSSCRSVFQWTFLCMRRSRETIFVWNEGTRTTSPSLIFRNEVGVSFRVVSTRPSPSMRRREPLRLGGRSR
jgi:hypothetical protein